VGKGRVEESEYIDVTTATITISIDNKYCTIMK
jgi:hypothetical protein